MFARPARPVRQVPQDLVPQIDRALEQVRAARAALVLAVEDQEPLLVRRAAYARLDRAFQDADGLLRRATRLVRDHSHQRGFYLAWSRWRHQLSQLSLDRQRAMFAAGDELTLPLGSVRAVDSGMAGPSIGEMQHGRARAPGSAAEYGMDLEATLARTTPAHRPVLTTGLSGEPTADPTAHSTAGPTDEPTTRPAPVPAPVPAAAAAPRTVPEAA